MQVAQTNAAKTAGAALKLKEPVTAYAFLILVSSVLFLAATAHGIGILPDSVAYMQIGSARHFAPLYTWLLQGLAYLGLNIVSAAWWLGWALLIANTLLILKLIQTSPLGIWWTAACAALIVLHPVFVEYHSLAMTEALFLTLALLSVLLFLRSLHYGTRIGFALVGIVVGAAMLARFAAAPLLPALLLARSLAGDRSYSRVGSDCFVLTLFSLIPFGAWVLLSKLATGSSTGRAPELLGSPDLTFWMSSLESLSITLLPSPVGLPVRLIFLAAVGGAFIWVFGAYVRWWLNLQPTRRTERALMMPIVCGAVAVFYALFLIASVYIQYRLNLIGRFFLPLYVFGALSATTACAIHIQRFLPARKVAFALVGFGGIIMASNVARTALFTTSAYHSGLGFASQSWSTSPVLQAVARLPADAILYSNAPDLIEFRLERSAAYLPARFNHLTGREGGRAPFTGQGDGTVPFAVQVDDLRRHLGEGTVYVVFIDEIDWRDYLITEQELRRQVPLKEVSSLSDGRVYKGGDK